MISKWTYLNLIKLNKDPYHIPILYSYSMPYISMREFVCTRMTRSGTYCHSGWITIPLWLILMYIWKSMCSQYLQWRGQFSITQHFSHQSTKKAISSAEPPPIYFATASDCNVCVQVLMCSNISVSMLVYICTYLLMCKNSTYSVLVHTVFTWILRF